MRLISNWFILKRAGLLVLAALPMQDRPGDLTAASASTDTEKFTAIQKEFQGYNKKVFPEVPAISVDNLLARQQKEKIVIVDVRSEEETAVSMIPGAITKTEFEANRERYKDHKIVTYCTIGYRSGLYAKKLRQENSDVVNLAGGVLAWAHAGKTFTCRTGETRKVHVYGKNWSLLPETYQPDW